jgi:mono/diheme cytochrome c family protein
MKGKSIIFAIPLVFFGAAAQAGDAGAGDAVYQDNCADCHFEDDFAGSSADDIKGLIMAIKGGSTDHKGGDLAGLSDEDIANLAAYFASFE